MTLLPTLLILTPVKDAAPYMEEYFQRLATLTYPKARLSLGLLESDSRDDTYAKALSGIQAMRSVYRRVGLWKKDFGYQLPANVPRWYGPIQIERRAVLARSRNHLIFHALEDEEYVLWLDVDVVEYPPNIIERLLASGREIVQPHCVLEYGGETFDKNGWRDQGRWHMDDMRDEGTLVPLHAVGGTMLLIKGDVHRDGLLFPPFLYGTGNPYIREGRGEVETEGLGCMAHDMGYTCWGMPNLEIRHGKW